MLCAIDICDSDVVSTASLSAVNALDGCTLADMCMGMEHFGNNTNDLAPKLNDTYALMVAGDADAAPHSTPCSTAGVSDPWGGTDIILDGIDFSITMTAPELAEAIRFKFVFFSVEYEEYIGDTYNDKFYAVLQAPTTTEGEPTIINYTECRDYAEYYDFDDSEGCDSASTYCCYIGINSSQSECCWYEGCPLGTAETDISGTGFQCAPDMTSDNWWFGSSSGWMQTSWPIEGGETFTLTFHVHDTSDAVYDSGVLIDAFEFLPYWAKGTNEVPD
jgi:hypothetical protein